jgi:AraC-like DNA-binding protein
MHAIASVKGQRGTRDACARSLECVSSVKDPVIASLARAVVSALERPAQASRLFLDQMGEVITTYLLEKYGGLHAPLAKTSVALPRHLELKAKDMLRSRLDGSVSIAAIADACALSRSYFSRAFREATGSTPHQWLTGQRLEKAHSMLKCEATTLADIAAACGFADQSHFTRVFTAAEGVSPGVWRKRFA